MWERFSDECVLSSSLWCVECVDHVERVEGCGATARRPAALVVVVVHLIGRVVAAQHSRLLKDGSMTDSAHCTATARHTHQPTTASRGGDSNQRCSVHCESGLGCRCVLC